MLNATQIAQVALEKSAAKKKDPGEMPEEPKVETPFKAEPGKTMWSKDQREALSDANKLQKIRSFGRNVAEDKPIAKWAEVAQQVLKKVGSNTVQTMSTTGQTSSLNDRLSSVGNPRTFGGNDVSKASQKKPKASNVHVTQLG